MSLARTLAVMRNNPFLSVLGEEGLKLLAFDSDSISLKPRESLFEAGEDASDAILFLGGLLRFIPQATGSVPRVYGVGELVDELALIVPSKRTATAIAQTSCEVFPLKRERMLRILNEYPQSARRLQRLIAQQSSEMIREVSSVQDRLRR
ncbi:MAG: cyclic nucleotide-binding domain-containing protein [Pseudomonadota bacterium]